MTLKCYNKLFSDFYACPPPTWWINLWLLNVAWAMGFLQKMTEKIVRTNYFQTYMHAGTWWIKLWLLNVSWFIGCIRKMTEKIVRTNYFWTYLQAPTRWVNLWLLNVARAMGSFHKMTLKCYNKLFSDLFAHSDIKG